MIFLKFWFGLVVRYRLSRRQRIERPSFSLVRHLIRSRFFLFAHRFTLSPRGQNLINHPLLSRRQVRPYAWSTPRGGTGPSCDGLTSALAIRLLASVPFQWISSDQ